MPSSSLAAPPRLAPPLPSKRNLTVSPTALPVRLPLTPPPSPPVMSPVSPLAPAAGDYAFLNAPPPKRSPHRLNALLPRRPTLSPRAATINHFQLDLSFLEEEPPSSPNRRESSVFASSTSASSRRTSTVSAKHRSTTDDYSDMLQAAAEGESSTGEVAQH